MTPLRQRMTEDMRVRNFSPLTIKLYLAAVIKFSLFFHKSPALLGPEEVRTYQVYLIDEKKASWSAFNIAVSALRFLYVVSLGKDWAFKKIPYARKPKTKPVILSLEEVCSFIKSLVNLKHRVLVMLTYSTGLRISEVLHLRVCDIDSKRMMIRVELGKGQKGMFFCLQRCCNGCVSTGRRLALHSTSFQDGFPACLSPERASIKLLGVLAKLRESPKT